jgi:ribosomal protein S19E (S16A)
MLYWLVDKRYKLAEKKAERTYHATRDILQQIEYLGVVTNSSSGRWGAPGVSETNATRQSQPLFHREVDGL